MTGQLEASSLLHFTYPVSVCVFSIHPPIIPHLQIFDVAPFLWYVSELQPSSDRIADHREIFYKKKREKKASSYPCRHM